MAAQTIAAGYPRALAAFAVLRGADRPSLLGQAGVSAADLEDPDHRIALPRYVALMEAATSACDENS